MNSKIKMSKKMSINLKNRRMSKINKNKMYNTKSGTVIEEKMNGMNHNQIRIITQTSIKRNKRSKASWEIINPTPSPIFKKINQWSLPHSLNKNPNNLNLQENLTWLSKSTWKNQIFPTIKIFKNLKKRKFFNSKEKDFKESKTTVNVN